MSLCHHIVRGLNITYDCCVSTMNTVSIMETVLTMGTVPAMEAMLTMVTVLTMEAMPTTVTVATMQKQCCMQKQQRTNI